MASHKTISSQHFTVAVALEEGRNRERIQQQLAKHGHSVQVLSELSKLESLPQMPAVIVLDENLTSKLNLERILEKHKTAQIIKCGETSGPSLASPIEQNQVWHLRSIEDEESLSMMIAKACIIHELAQRTAELENVVGGGVGAPQLQYRSLSMKALMQRVKQTALRDSTVILRGETGTGKTTIARLIHEQGERKNGPFLTLSCAALPKELLEAELFGYERGAFTGASQSRPGCAELADGGTLFLDEIGDLPFELQPKLLTFLQERWVRRIGGRDIKHPNVRIISATHRNLKEMVKEGTFREDLLYRLEVLELVVPPLRERKEDIEAICEFFLLQSAERRGESARHISVEALRKLEAHRWPGNVRELQNVLERALAYADGSTINANDLHLREAEQITQAPNKTLAGLTLEQVERQAIRDTLDYTGGDKVAAAKMLGISLKSIYNKLKN